MTHENAARDWTTICDSEWAALRDDQEFMEFCHALLEGWTRACPPGWPAAAWETWPWDAWSWRSAPPKPASPRDAGAGNADPGPAGTDAAARTDAAAAASRPRHGGGAPPGDPRPSGLADGPSDLADGLADLE